MPVKGARLCGARCRSKDGAPCEQPAMRGSNRCKMHFGHSRNLKTHGRLTIQAEAERKQQRKLLKEMEAINKEIEADE
jgi:hypothetical protein